MLPISTLSLSLSLSISYFDLRGLKLIQVLQNNKLCKLNLLRVNWLKRYSYNDFIRLIEVEPMFSFYVNLLLQMFIFLIVWVIWLLVISKTQISLLINFFEYPLNLTFIYNLKDTVAEQFSVHDWHLWDNGKTLLI